MSAEQPFSEYGVMPNPNRTDDVGVEARYFREYGVHNVDDLVSVFSFPDWAGLEQALLTELPDSGVVLTTELATFTGPHEELVGSANAIEERVEFVRECSAGTDAEIWLGAPIVPPTEWHDWRNSVLTFVRGEIVGRTDKILLSAYEQAHSPVKRAPRESARFVNPIGMSALICSDMIASSSMKYMGRQWPGKTLLIPTCWASVPKDAEMDEWRAGWIEKSGGVDNYFKSQLERGVRMAFEASDAETIIVADRNAPNSGVDGPYNAVFYRV